MTKHIQQLLTEQADLWHVTRNLGQSLGCWGWERKLRSLTATTVIPTITNQELVGKMIACTPGAVLDKHDRAQHTIDHWIEWRKLDRSNKIMIRNAKRAQLEQIIATARDAQDKGDLTSLWKMIHNVSGKC